MRQFRTKCLALLLGLSLPVVAAAGPVTGATPVPAATDSGSQSDEDRESERGRGAAATAFDGGSLFDVIGMPLLRVSAPIYLQLSSRNKLRAAGDESGGGGADGGADGGAPLMEDPGPGIGNVAVTVPSIPGGLVGPGLAIPEPAALALLAPVLVVMLRRRMLDRRS